jgi:hypothetical protein
MSKEKESEQLQLQIAKKKMSFCPRPAQRDLRVGDRACLSTAPRGTSLTA